MIPKRYYSTSHSLPPIYSTSSQIRGLLWGVVKNLLERLVTETPFKLTFVNNPEGGKIENRVGLAKMMKTVTPHGAGARDILEKLDNIVLTELQELLVLPTKEVSRRRKFKAIVILHEEPRSLENSVEFAVKSLSDADLPDDRIGIHFVQVGFSRRLFDALKDVVDNDDTNLADFTTYAGPGSIVDERLGKISLGGVDATFSQPPETSRPTSRQIIRVPADPPPNSLAIERATSIDGSVTTSKTYDLGTGFTFTGWIFQKDRQESGSPYEFFSFYNGQAPLLRASAREGQGNSVTMWFPDVSAYPTARDCPTGVWTFICATYDGTGVRLGFNGHLGNKAPLARLKFEKINFRMCASNSISLANIKIYDRVLTEDHRSKGERETDGDYIYSFYEKKQAHPNSWPLAVLCWIIEDSGSTTHETGVPLGCGCGSKTRTGISASGILLASSLFATWFSSTNDGYSDVVYGTSRASCELVSGLVPCFGYEWTEVRQLPWTPSLCPALCQSIPHLRHCVTLLRNTKVLDTEFRPCRASAVDGNLSIGHGNAIKLTNFHTAKRSDAVTKMVWTPLPVWGMHVGLGMSGGEAIPHWLFELVHSQGDHDHNHNSFRVYNYGVTMPVQFAPHMGSMLPPVSRGTHAGPGEGGRVVTAVTPPYHMAALADNWTWGFIRFIPFLDWNLPGMVGSSDVVLWALVMK
ncbi:hypothetical protein DFH07DRAFT_771581 [Mycena maculata]|uniref:Uncharacterized protein n=1 Tax=Mycena maculata TaxID=230809 RepID=A0AAD7NGF1_9AGAR|nr:hypothetical protein DFH07DRAFT_771581 [Mycena maculata]